ncbi:hypothetical protein [Streptomyces sp. NPDC057460]|uniref:hypothetical protein n=1 Tax=Streptomyces sp. NPDC057460 TaxID=3346141 RepID=UPI00369872CA
MVIDEALVWEPLDVAEDDAAPTNSFLGPRDAPLSSAAFQNSSTVTPTRHARGTNI